MPASDGNALPESARGWTVHRPESTPLPALMPILGPIPAGWTKLDTSALTTGTTGPARTALAPGRRYRLGTYAERDSRESGPGFEFTLDDLTALHPGRALVGYLKNFRTNTEVDFRSRTQDSCDG